jgi:phosphate transport system permease protein
MNIMSQLRKWINRWVLALIVGFSVVVLLPLGFIFFYLIYHGFDNFTWSFFTELPKPPGETGGGMLHAVVGTLYLMALSGVLAVPMGLAGGVLLAELPKSRFTSAVRFVIDLLNGTPSIVVGIFIYAILVKPLKGFSALAGGVALAVVILPIIVKSVEEILRLVPNEVRMAGLGLGLPRWRVVANIVVWGSRQNLLPGVLLALARSSGETAPLLFTAFGSMYLSYSLTSPMASLPVEIYNYSISPYERWHELAWTGSLALIFLVFLLNISAKVFFSGKWKNLLKAAATKGAFNG